MLYMCVIIHYSYKIDLKTFPSSHIEFLTSKEKILFLILLY